MDQKTFVKGFHNENDVSKMVYKQLGSTDMKVSCVSLGGAPLGNVYGDCNEHDAIEMTKFAISSGINYIDTAPWYGQGKSEQILGKALEDVPRSAYYIGTKVGRYELDIHKMFDFSSRKVTERFYKSLSFLKLDYVDLIQIHDAEFGDENTIINETLPALQKIVNSGKARYIGITGYQLSSLKSLYELSKIKISTILTFSRYTLIDDELTNYLPLFKKSNIGLINGSVLAMGLLTLGGAKYWHIASEEMKIRCCKAAAYAKEKGYNIAHLAIKYSFGLSDITTNLLGSADSIMLRGNIEAALSPVTDDEKQLIDDIREKFFKNMKQKNWEGSEAKLLEQMKMNNEQLVLNPQ